MKNYCTRLLLLIFISFTGVCNYAQIVFHNAFGGFHQEIGYSGCLTYDGGYIICGSSLSFVTDIQNIYLVKCNEFGDTVWTKSYGQSGATIGYSIIETDDYGFLIAGSQGHGAYNGFLLKTDMNGTIMWAKNATGVNVFYSIDKTHDGGYIATGYGGTTNTSIILIKVSDSGNVLWSKSLGSNTYEDRAYSVKQTSDYGFIVAGYTLGYGAGNYDAYLIKTDSLGNVQWSRTYGNTYSDYFYSVQETSDSGYIAIGVKGQYSYLVKTDNAGDTLWTKKYVMYFGKDVKQNPDKSYIMVATSPQYRINLVKTDPDGEVLWAKKIGGIHEEYGNFVTPIPHGGYFIIGRTNSFGAGQSDIFFVKTDSLGNTHTCHETDPSIVALNTSTIVQSGCSSVNANISFSNITTYESNPPTIVTNICGYVNINSYTASDNFFILYPNPFNDFLKCDTEIDTPMTITVYNYMGQHIIEKTFLKSIEINTEMFPKGTYTFMLSDNEQIYKVGKIIKN